MASSFISYASMDFGAAKQIRSKFEQVGLSVFDDMKLVPGQRFDAEINRRLTEADIVAILWSKNAANSEWVRRETRKAIRAWAAGKLLMLIRLDNTELPPGLSDLRALRVYQDSAGILTDGIDGVEQELRRLRELIAPRAHQEPFLSKRAPDRSGAARRSFFVSCLIFMALASVSVWPTSSDADVVLETPQILLISMLAVASMAVFLIVVLRLVRRAPGYSESIRSIAANEEKIDVFVSYSSEDRKKVDQLVEALKSHGIYVWIDTQQQGTETRYAGRIVRAIRACRSVLVMCSENAFQSDHVVREVYVSGDNKKPFIAVELDEADFPDDFQYFLSGFPRLNSSQLDPTEFGATISRLLSI